jgi:hypothetical protein
VKTTRLPVIAGLAAALAIGGGVAALNLMDSPAADAEDASVEVSASGEVCGEVNGFTITAQSGPVDCEAALAMATAYTAAVLAPDARLELGSGLFWSEKGWTCSRDYDESGLTSRAHGLLCQRDNAIITLVS